MQNPYFWSDMQKQLLEQAYRHGGGLQTAQDLIPGKPRSAIAAKACRMQLTVPRPRKANIPTSPST